jgi:hypothetical protein
LNAISGLKSALWMILFVLGLSGIVIPAIYLYNASSVPPLESESDLEKLMRSMVEGERMSLQMALGSPDKTKIAYERPELAQIPKDFVAFFISQLGCPSYFATPQETGSAWSWRVYGGEELGSDPPGDGRCERYLALSIAEDINVPPGLPRAIAANRIHGFLKKDQLVAYYLSGLIFDRGVVGIPAATQALYGKTPDQLGLADLAEFSLVLPFNGYYDDIASCRAPAQLQIARDQVLLALAKQQLVARERAETATHQPLACLKAH